MSHPRFAYLNWILKTLFRTLQIDADPHHIEQLAKTNLSPIAPFVNKVNLTAPLHSWTCTLEIFKKIVRFQTSQVEIDDSWKKFVDQY